MQVRLLKTVEIIKLKNPIRYQGATNHVHNIHNEQMYASEFVV